MFSNGCFVKVIKITDHFVKGLKICSNCRNFTDSHYGWILSFPKIKRIHQLHIFRELLLHVFNDKALTFYATNPTFRDSEEEDF